MAVEDGHHPAKSYRKTRGTKTKNMLHQKSTGRRLTRNISTAKHRRRPRRRHHHRASAKKDSCNDIRQHKTKTQSRTAVQCLGTSHGRAEDREGPARRIKTKTLVAREIRPCDATGSKGLPPEGYSRGQKYNPKETTAHNQHLEAIHIFGACNTRPNKQPTVTRVQHKPSAWTRHHKTTSDSVPKYVYIYKICKDMPYRAAPVPLERGPMFQGRHVQ